MSPIELSLIVAMTPERAIGYKGALPWKRLPSDMAHFKKVTLAAGTVIMGRATYESILARNGKPLSQRNHIVLTKKCAPCTDRSVTFVSSLEEVYDEVVDYGGRACVIGGGEIYKLFLPLPYVRKAYVTVVHAPYLPGDVYFPTIETSSGTEWRSTESTAIQKWDPNDEYETSLSLYERVE